jgi:hypothetical protein
MRSRSGILLTIALFFVGHAAMAAAPQFSNILPRGVQRGTEVEVTLSGRNLEDAEELLLYDTGLEVLELEPNENGRQVKVKLKVAEDCSLGTQRMRIRTRTGLSDLQNLYVGPYPVIEEQEPNSFFDEPQPIEKNVTVHGRIDREDVDYFVVEAKKGERLSVEVFGMRLGFSTGTNYFDPYVAILDEDRFELAVSDDHPLAWNDCLVSITVPKDGKYTIQIRDASYNGDGRAYYLAHIGNFPRPTAVIPAGGKPGETLEVTFVGDVSGAITREITLPRELPTDMHRFGLEVADEQGVAPTLQPFRLVDLPNTIEQEPNNSRDEATAGTVPGAFNGVISEEGDIDYFKFSAKKDQEFDFEVYARRIRTGLDPVLHIYRASDGRRLAGNDDSRGPDSYQKFKIPEDGEYLIAVHDHLRRGDPSFAYRVEVTPVEPTVVGEPIEPRRYVQPQIEIPQGAGSGFVVNVTRDGFGGPVIFRSDELPEGVRIECPEGWRSDGRMPVVFYADEDAPIAGRFSRIVTYHENDDRTIEGPIMQKILMIRGRNNNRVWEEYQYKLPIVVTEKVPFKVWIEEPKVPLVRGGSMKLLVKCEKEEDWDEEISLQLLQNPPGVSSSRSVKIPKGKTEAEIPINAAGNAAVRESLISLSSSATVGNGSIELCTPFVSMRVEEQYMTFEFADAAVEQGAEVPLAVTVEHHKEFEGEAEVELLGLPANATAEKLKVTKDTEELVFTVKATEKTPPGTSKNIFCRVLVPENGDHILHNLGSGRLRVDKPLPKKTESKPEPKVADKEPEKKPLSRLEQLRLEQKEREEAGGGGGEE